VCVTAGAGIVRVYIDAYKDIEKVVGALVPVKGVCVTVCVCVVCVWVWCVWCVCVVCVCMCVCVCGYP